MRKRKAIKPIQLPMPEMKFNHTGLYRAFEKLLNIRLEDYSKRNDELISQLWEKRGMTPIRRCRQFSLKDLADMF